MKNCLKTYLPVLLAMFAANFVCGQSDQGTIDIPRKAPTFGQKPVPVSLEGFSGEVADVLKFDLYVQGFCFTNANAAQYLISGNNSGNVTGSVTDTVAKRAILPSRIYTGTSSRRQAHAFADDIVLAITGKKGIGQTRIAFKAQPSSYGPGEIYISDFDGHNSLPVTTDKAIVAAPAWVPGRHALCYTSYQPGHPDIFYNDLSTGQRRILAGDSALNNSAAVSPDGSKVAMVMDKTGTVNIWLCNIDGSGSKKLTSTEEDSSPCWSPDGKWICYATKIQSRRVLAKVPAGGGAVQVIRTSGAPSPTEPDWSPDGKWIAFTRQAGDFDICVVPADGSADPVVVAAGEDPSWSPNSRTLVFAKRTGGSYVLSVLDVFTKQVKDVPRISGSDSEPAWAK